MKCQVDYITSKNNQFLFIFSGKKSCLKFSIFKTGNNFIEKICIIRHFSR